MYKSKNPTLVDTPSTEGVLTKISYARTSEGRVDLSAYEGLSGVITANNLKIDVRINKARIRYGHLDLNVSPASGTGTVWVERKNIEIPGDPASKTAKVSKIAAPKPANAFPAAEIQKMIRAIVAEEVNKTAI